MVNPHVGNDVEKCNGLPANVEGTPVQSTAGESQAQIREGDEEGLTRAEDGRGRLKVAHAQPALVVTLKTLLSGGSVDQEVSLPSSQLVEDQLNDLDNGRILDHLRVQVKVGQTARGALIDGLGHESHVLLHVAGVVVVTVVAVLPAEVGDEQG